VPFDFPQGKLTKIKRPSVVFMVMDGIPRTYYWGVSVFEEDKNWTVWTWQDLANHHAATEALDFLRHRYRANVLFLDFHVESVPMTPKGLDSIGISKGIYE
jgi:prepilin-type processing-associated H-X9-DG protein